MCGEDSHIFSELIDFWYRIYGAAKVRSTEEVVGVVSRE
jgi:hypothetical protein